VFAILVDLDGTIINSGPGIINSYQYALRCMGWIALLPRTSPGLLAHPPGAHFRS
jgi:phosphoglycolate phosphatase-like HAD superfamily hydrolase